MSKNNLRVDNLLINPMSKELLTFPIKIKNFITDIINQYN